MFSYKRTLSLAMQEYALKSWWENKRKQSQTDAFQSLIFFGPLLGDSKWTFQQDNAPSYTSKSTKECLKKGNNYVLPWPSRKPWPKPQKTRGVISLPKYMKISIKQYHSTHELERILIIEKWDSIPA